MGSSESDETLETYGAEIGTRSRSGSRFREWVLIEADRVLIAAIISVVVFFLLLVLHRLGIVSFVNPNSVTRVASGMIAGTFSLVTLVVSINQLILSQEFASAGKAQERLDSVIDFRRTVADETGATASPVSPTKFLELLIESIARDAEALAAAVDDHDEAVRRAIVLYTNAVQAECERIDETLEHTSFGTFRAVLAATAYDEDWQLHVGAHLRNAYDDSLSPTATERLEELHESLKLFHVAGEQFKTTYLQRELTRFSQLTVYAGVPSILSAIFIGLLYADVTGPSISIAALPYVTIGLIVVVLSPLALLVSFILRTTTITRRTASAGPMLPQKAPEEGPFDVIDGD
ncbi:hypothetical protein [Natrinema sp. 1APR25-10V2]|uniref:hypothetical protein n=1 Tax=Natrinema sp. 1APR25-10V2 TaxID=2951081 RepID=UPI00287485D6|nr:hypothetical protein [Natrinema sp. 1APR25-10V2]MDS0473904.1 hypothetical protein [Natrinema sp. 1APR25-10V2]